ncbi:MAG TPA: vWA domain-containing protein [Polyangiaceae bacterium]
MSVGVLIGALLLGCGSRTSLDSGEPPPTPEFPTEPPGVPGVPAGGAPPVAPPPIAGSPAEPPMKPPPCESKVLTFDELRPSVTLLVDQSGSMQSGYPSRGSDQTRWSLIRHALFDETTGVVKELDRSMHFGLTLYTSHNGFSGGVCPILNQVRAATGNYEAIRKLYDSMSPDDDTPTGAALAQVVRQIRAEARVGPPQVLLLVTDGDPDTCDVPDPQTDGAQLEAVAAARAARAAGIHLYVVGVSADISGDKLQQLANAAQDRRLDAKWGVDPDAAQPFQASGDVTAVTAQLRDILTRIPLCEIALGRDVEFGELENASVLLDGVPLELGATDGFELSDPRHLRVTGKACETLRATGRELHVRISCD